MKLKLFILFAGIVCTDIACERGCHNITYEITGINLLLGEIVPGGDSKVLERDSIPFDSLLFIVGFEEKLISDAGHLSLINNAYARAACEGAHTNLRLDSIKIFSVKNTQTVDVTNHFTLMKTISGDLKIDNSAKFNERLNDISYWSPIVLNIKRTTPPARKDTCQFNFQFFENHQLLFETMSAPVIIMP